jgi:hypothetical protein
VGRSCRFRRTSLRTVTATTIPLWILAIVALAAFVRWCWPKREHSAKCGDLSTHGWICNKDDGHEGMHMFYDPGTGRGDDKMIRWDDTGSAFRS